MRIGADRPSRTDRPLAILTTIFREMGIDPERGT